MLTTAQKKTIAILAVIDAAAIALAVRALINFVGGA